MKNLQKHTKNPAAVALGRLGGLKGGKARAKVLTAAQRKASARKAAKARWATRRKKKVEGGQGGKRGHSNMCHFISTEEIKVSTRILRRREARAEVQRQVKDLTAGDAA